MPSGGARPGAGRKKKNRSEQVECQDAESYLSLVVEGKIPPDALRISAAKALIRYQTTKKRALPKAPADSQLRQKAELETENVNLSEFEEKARKIRARFGRKK